MASSNIVPVDAWREKLAHLQVELAKASNAAQKFEIRKNIAEAEAEISNLLRERFEAGPGLSGTIRSSLPLGQVLFLAGAATPDAQLKERARIFGEFAARVLMLFGHDHPSIVTSVESSDGIELDVTSQHIESRKRLIAEFRAHSSPIGVRDLKAFYGKLGVERLDDQSTVGYFVAIPCLSEDARVLHTRLESLDAGFKSLDASSVIQILLNKGTIVPLGEIRAGLQSSDAPLSDSALLVTDDGFFYAAKELSPSTRLPVRVLVYPATLRRDVPSRVVELLGANVAYTSGLSCGPASDIVRSASTAGVLADDSVIEVAGSSSDFEYQFPAAPRYFVGRKDYVAEAKALLDQIQLGQGSRARLLVLNAQSGWGKSSLALRLTDLARSLGGLGVCIDCRTASQPAFVSAAVRHALLKAQKDNVLALPRDASFASVASTVETIRRCVFSSDRHPLCVIFDQFENVFQNGVLTREFRDLAFGVSELSAPILLGFSWKTDFVAFTEGYPYQLRDHIRSRSAVFPLPPFGPAEIGELISRLQRSCGQKLHPYLRGRIREYSQGLPWLIKKLGSHIIREIKGGATQDELLAEVLNIQSLFESDISGLNIAERQALKAIARRAPLAVAEAVELASGEKDIVQSLLTQRLLVSVGDKLDVYWDVFRDYLNQGTVPLQDGYILRLTPNTTSKLLIAINTAGGPITTDEAARALDTSAISVLNMARDLRQLGVLAAQEGVLRFADEVANAPDLNAAIRNRVAVALKRHRVYSLLTSLVTSGSRVLASHLAESLPKVYPAIAAKKHTWDNYARAFAYWFQFAGLISIERDELMLGEVGSIDVDLMVPGKKRAIKGIVSFPQSSFGPVLDLVRDIAESRDYTARRSARRALVTAKAIALVEQVAARVILTSRGAALASATPSELPAEVRLAIEGHPAFWVGRELLERDPGAPAITVGTALARELKLDWSASTAEWVGKNVRSWMRAAGIRVAPRPAPEVRQLGLAISKE